MQAKMNAVTLADTVCQGIYNYGKAKLFNVLEAQFEGQRLSANKKMVNDVLVTICNNTQNLLLDMLGDWEQDITIPADALVPVEEAKEAQQDYEEYQKAVK